MTKPPTNLMQTAMSVLVLFLAFLGIGAVGYFLATGGANEKFAEYPLLTRGHGILGAVYLALAPLQFSKKLRTRFLNFHRWSGRFLFLIGLVIGVSALFMAVVIPYSGFSEQIIIGFFSALFLVSLVISFRSIRAKNIEQHRQWMIRAFAIGLSIATMRLIFVPGLILFELSRQQTEAWSIISFTIAFVLHCSAAELWIRKTKGVRVT